MTKKNRIILDVLVMLVIPVLFVFALRQVVIMNIIIASTLLLIGWFISRFNIHEYVTYGLAFLLPLSVESEVIDGYKFFLPTEPMIVIICSALLFDVLIKKVEWSKFIHFFKQPLALLLITLVMVVFSGNLIVSVKHTLVYGAYVLCFLGFLFLKRKTKSETFNKLMSCYTAGYVLVLFWALQNWSSYQFNSVTIPGIFEPFYADHTIFGASGAILAIYWLGAVFMAGNIKLKVTRLFIFILVLAAVRLSGSRAAILSIPVGFLFMFSLNGGFAKKHFAIMLILLSVLAVFFQVEIRDAFVYNKYKSRDQHAGLIQHTASVTNVQTDESNIERLNRWVAAINMFKQKPLTGFGPGNYQYAYIPFQDQKWMNRLSLKDPYHIPQNSGGTVHSEPLLYLSELGIFGFLAWLWFVLSLVKKGIGSKPKFRNWFMAFSFGMIGTYLFHGLFNNFLTTDKFAFLFWGSVGFFILHYYDERKREELL